MGMPTLDTLPITRLDMVEIAEGRYLVNEIAERAGDRNNDVTVRSRIKEASLATLIASFEKASGWTLRVFPGGARAWRGKPRSVRTRGRIKMKQKQLERQGCFASNYDLRYDFF